MTWRKGIAYAKEKSTLKEELDDISADYVVELYKAGCWGELSTGAKKGLCKGARSAWQDSDLSDNRTGRICALQDKCTNESMEYACLKCCIENRVGPKTPDGPPDRDWGNRKDDIAEPCSEYLGPDPAGSGSGGS